MAAAGKMRGNNPINRRDIAGLYFPYNFIPFL
jgi:hypothetical protein